MTTADPKEILKKYWGFDAFRPLQDEIVQSVLDGKDTLALMPTGGGKSICFQVPALCREGICVVVSPLIALMKDQVINLEKRNIPAAAIFSGMAYRDIDRTFDNCIHGNIKLLYLSPERLESEMAIERIRQMNLNLLAVDEAHCISQWGYDFRPPYLNIASIRKLHPDVPVLAVTATATPDVVQDIQEKLEFQKKNVFQKSFSRSNLAYVVLKEENKLGKLKEILKKVPGTGVVYARNRRMTKEVAIFLRKQGFSADFYHAGLESEERTKKQEAWIHDKTQIMVCTNAFGMGIDKPDVRTVVHMDLPDSLEAYFQEAGRAGRDGKKSFAVLLYADEDKINLLRNYEMAFPTFKEIKKVYRALGSYFQLAVGSAGGQAYDFDITSFAKTYDLEVSKTFYCLKILEQQGWIALTEAVFIPATIHFKVSREDLYDFQIKNRKYETVIKSIIRAHPGIFNHYVSIFEGKLANFMKIKQDELVRYLEILRQEGIIDYIPKKEKPQLTFMKERVDAGNLTIDTKMYEFRKQRQKYRIDCAIKYAEEIGCRSVSLLAYFGENNASPCGICDVCLGRTDSEVTSKEYESLKEKILRLLTKESLTQEQIIESFHKRHEEKLLRTLEFMVDEKVITKKLDRFHLPS